MRVYRGRGETIETDREATRRLLEVAATGEPAVRVWTPHRQVAFGRRDAAADGYDLARHRACDRGFPPVERNVGGRAVAYDGETTLAFARAEPVSDSRRGIQGRYGRTTDAVAGALRDLGASVVRGEPPDSFCPGTHSLRERTGGDSDAGDPTAAGGKLAGIAQRVTTDAAVVAGVVVIDEPEALAEVLEAVYEALSVPFDPNSVGSVAGAGGPADPDAVGAAVEDALVGEAEPEVERVEE